MNAKDRPRRRKCALPVWQYPPAIEILPDDLIVPCLDARARSKSKVSTSCNGFELQLQPGNAAGVGKTLLAAARNDGYLIGAAIDH